MLSGYIFTNVVLGASYLIARAGMALGSSAPSTSLGSYGNGQDEEDRPIGGALIPQYTQTEKRLIREICKKEIRRGNLFDPVLPATWKPFHNQASHSEISLNEPILTPLRYLLTVPWSHWE